ncbi:tetratricopeptide repeat protein [Plebeiibacterium marinum]|uniref:Tetratricopeptide repeat protein n=1 Tax=Plebeiibacterium marinum TaxID=2992111 RepID=A0AAE3SJR2_9BACT|nr:tetratricopeptide repeat protein [Plebeiobacterium marinum]MCW3804640.1 tetratricopeptide repeat protein [Plebeiobacterium marinum]
MGTFLKKIIIILCLFTAVHASAQINTDKVIEAGRFALYQQEYVLAISFFNKAIESKPYWGLPYYFRARAKYSLDDVKGAENDMNKAIEIIPFYYEFYSFRGNIRAQLGDYEGSLADYAKGLEMEPQDISILFNRGLAHMQKEEWEQGVDDFSSVLKISPGQYGAYINRAISKLNLKDTIGAVTDMDEAILVNPLVAEAYRFSAAIYYDINEFDKALERIGDAINIDPREPMYYYLRGAIRYQVDDLEGTMSDFNKVIELQPKNIMAYANRGLLRAEVGDVNNAISDFSRVLALNPNDLLTLFNRSLLFLRVGEYREALSDLNLIIKHYPNYAQAYMARSEAFAGLNMKAEQTKDMNMAMKLEHDKRRNATQDGENQKSGKKKPKETRSEDDQDISNHDKIAVLDDFTTEDNEVDEITDLKGKIQFRDIVIDLEKVFSLTFFSEDAETNRSRYYKPELTRFNSRNVFNHTLVFSNNEVVNEGDDAFRYYRTIEEATLKLNKYPDNNDLRFIRAILYGVVLNYSNAIKDYDYLIEHTPKNHPELILYHMNRAAVRFKMVEVMKSFEEEDLPEKLITGMNTSKAKANEEDKVVKRMLDYDLVERDLKQVIELNPGYEFAYFNLGVLYCVKKDYKGAVNQFTNAIKLNPQFAEAYFNRGLTRIYLKMDKEGTGDLSRAGELGLYKAYNIIKRYGKQKEAEVEAEESEE